MLDAPVAKTRVEVGWLLAGLTIALGGCDGAPVPDGGPTIEPDGGSDAGQVGEDAGPDGGEPGDCQGPPGLYMAGSCDVLEVGVRAYRPRYVLWSDAADKDRFIFIPPGTQIDTTDPNNWVYPMGTRVYKNFSHDGVRLETRLLEKQSDGTGPAAWYMRTFAWNAGQDRVTEVTDADASIRENVLGTEHDIPSGADCVTCHSGTLDTVNSFTAIQLNHDGASFTLQMLLDEGWLTTPVTTSAAQVPGTPTESEALGYLHSNCGNCHRPTPMAGNPLACRTPACGSGLHMWVDVGLANVDATATYETAVGVAGTFFDPDAPDAVCRTHPGAPDTSTIIVRMESRGDSSQMPPLGTEIIHPEGIATIRAWITGLTASSADCVR